MKLKLTELASVGRAIDNLYRPLTMPAELTQLRQIGLIQSADALLLNSVGTIINDGENR